VTALIRNILPGSGTSGTAKAGVVTVAANTAAKNVKRFFIAFLVHEVTCRISAGFRSIVRRSAFVNNSWSFSKQMFCEKIINLQANTGKP
jgi:hypothetical protein